MPWRTYLPLSRTRTFCCASQGTQIFNIVRDPPTSLFLLRTPTSVKPTQLHFIEHNLIDLSKVEYNYPHNRVSDHQRYLQPYTSTEMKEGTSLAATTPTHASLIQTSHSRQQMSIHHPFNSFMFPTVVDQTKRSNESFSTKESQAWQDLMEEYTRTVCRSDYGDRDRVGNDLEELKGRRNC